MGAGVVVRQTCETLPCAPLLLFLGPMCPQGNAGPGALPAQQSNPQHPLICPLPVPSPCPMDQPAPTYITASILHGGALTFAAFSGRVAGLDHVW